MRAIVVGSGAGGATAARELARAGLEVTVLEAGDPFTPYTRNLGLAKGMRRLGLLRDPGSIRRYFPPLEVTSVGEGGELKLFRGLAEGGSTNLTCGNLVRAEEGLLELGLDLSEEFSELEAELGVTTVPRERWRPATAAMFDAAAGMGLHPVPTPKAVDQDLCVGCGLCELGCATGARWDSRRFLEDLRALGGRVVTGSPVRRVVVEGGAARGVVVGRGRAEERLHADLVVLAAGGLGTPRVLEASGVKSTGSLWVDIVLTVGGVLEGSRQLEEQPMLWHARREGHILSPYVDVLSHFFHRPWRGVPLEDRVGVMVKLADTEGGSVAADGKVTKRVTGEDRRRLAGARDLAARLMEEAGVGGPFVDGMLNGGHLGGTCALSPGDVDAMRPSHLPEGLWVADLSLVPTSQGLPTMLTTAALALRVSRRVAAAAGG